jgi:hypothetical protein
MSSAAPSNILRWLGWMACAIWLAGGLYITVLNQDAGQFDFRAPDVAAELKGCTSADRQQRYDCTEHAILSHQRLQFLQASGNAVLIFAPPILIWWLARRLARRPNDPGVTPPSIQKWRVR